MIYFVRQLAIVKYFDTSTKVDSLGLLILLRAEY